MSEAAAWVRTYPGHTAIWYDRFFPGRATYGRTYDAFKRAVRHGLVVAKPNPERAASVVYFPKEK